MHLSRKQYGKYQDRSVDLYTINNGNGLVVSLTNFGGIVTSIRTPDRHGVTTRIVPGYQTLEEYVKDTDYIGCLIGRYANRISKGRFQIDGRPCQLVCNDDGNHLHGGGNGFNKRIWEVQPIRESRGCGVSLSLISPDGDEGYPGTMDVQVLYLLTPDNALIADFSAATDTRTIINLSQHCYFNLAGSITVQDHFLRINASGYTPLDSKRIPTGVLKRVDGTVLDLRKERRLGAVLDDYSQQDLFDGGFDHHFALDDAENSNISAATLYHPESGRTLDIYTTQPGLQVLTGNFSGQRSSDGSGVFFCRHGTLCLAAQHFPDSPNQRAFPSVILSPAAVYRQTTRFQFGVRR